MAMRSIFQNDTVMARHLDGDDDDDDALNQTAETASNTDSETLAPSRDVRNGERGYNTGPKGVRSDAKAFAVSRKTERDAAEAKELERMRSIGQAETWREQDARERWVEARLKELSKQRQGSTAGVGLESVDAGRYLELVESTRDLLVLISPSAEDEEELEEEEQVDDDRRDRVADLLDALSQVFAGRRTRAICLSAGEAEIDPVACPALLRYRDGELVETRMRIDDGLRPGEAIDAATVERLLLRLGCLPAEDDFE